ncbi:RuvX/YqgF family protein [Mycoplasmoides genitalium]
MPIILVDESNTTSAVKDKLITMDLKHKDFKKAKDTLAAVLILERFFQNYH